MKKIVFLVAISVLILAGNAFAFPLVDGSVGIGEWTTGAIVSAGDPNEAGIPDVYDIKHITMIPEASGGANDGLYMLWELYGTPTFTTLDPDNIIPVVYSTRLDMNQDGDRTDAVDRRIEYRSSGLVVYDGLGAVVAGSPSAVMGSVVEFYIPGSMFAGFPDTSFNGFLLLDNGGAPADDQLPDEGNFKTPEPGSASLIGLGLLGLVGALRRKFMA